MKRKSKDVAAYFEALTPERREALEAVRALILEAAPDVNETMKYRMPTYEYSDDMLCALASQKHYMSLYMDPPVVQRHREELEGLTKRLNLQVVHAISTPPNGWKGERGRIHADMMARYLPENRVECGYFICGPEPMQKAVKKALQELGLPLEKVQSESFNFV